MKTTRERAEERRQAKLESVREQVETGEVAIVRGNDFLYPDAFRGGQQRDLLISTEARDPRPVRTRPTHQHFRRNTADAGRVAKVADEVLGALQLVNIAGQHDAIPCGVRELDVRPKELRQSIHGMVLRSRQWLTDIAHSRRGGLFCLHLAHRNDAAASFQVYLARK